MKSLKAIFSALLVLMLICLPLTVGATGENESEVFSLTLECLIDGKVPENTDFTFAVTESELIYDDEHEVYILGESNKIADFTVSTKTNTDGKAAYTFPEKSKNGRVHYLFKMKSCSAKGVALDPIEIRVSFFSAENVKAEVYKNNEPVGDMTFVDEPALITFNCVAATTVKISTKDCENFTKVYDGKLSAAITEKNYKLEGVAAGHDVKLKFEKAEFNSANVKNATKITVSGLSLTGKDADKYALSVSKFEVQGTITKRPLTVTADNLVMTLGQKEPTLTYALSEELMEGDKAVGTLHRASGNTVGTYPVTRGTLSFGDNYEVTFVDGSLTISNFPNSEIKDESTSVKISGYFDKTATLKVTALDPNGDAYLNLAAGTTWGKILLAYDIEFKNSGFDGNLNISIPVDAKLNGKNVTVYQQMSNGSIACYKLTATDGAVTVLTDECSQFMLVTEKEKQEESSSSTAMTVLKTILIILAVIVGLALLIAILFFGMIFFNKTEQLKAIIKAIKKLFRK